MKRSSCAWYGSPANVMPTHLGFCSTVPVFGRICGRLSCAAGVKATGGAPASTCAAPDEPDEPAAPDEPGAPPGPFPLDAPAPWSSAFAGATVQARDASDADERKAARARSIFMHPPSATAMPGARVRARCAIVLPRDGRGLAGEKVRAPGNALGPRRTRRILGDPGDPSRARRAG